MKPDLPNWLASIRATLGEMDQTALAKKLAAKSSLDEAAANKFIDAFSEVIGGYIASGEKVILADFGSFDRNGDNIRFNPSAKLRDLVK